MKQRGKVRVTGGRIQHIRSQYDEWNPKKKSFENLLDKLIEETGIYSSGVIKVIIAVYANNFYRKREAKQHKLLEKWEDLTEKMKKVLAGFDSELSPIVMTYLFNFYFEDHYVTPICPKLVKKYRKKAREKYCVE